jgi:hypothetical protein
MSWTAAIGLFVLRVLHKNLPEFLPNLHAKKKTNCNANVRFSELIKVSEFRKDAKELQKH